MKNLTDLAELTLGSRLKKISDQLFDDVDLIYREHGITLSSRCFPILFLLKANGDSGVTQLAEQLGQAHSSVSQMSRKLIGNGLVANNQDPADERRRVLSLTDEGHALFKTMDPVWQDIRQSVKGLILDSDFELMAGLLALENQLQRRSLASRVQERQRLREASKVEIIPFQTQYRDDFKRLNVEWLEKYFYVEAIDDQVLSNPETYILKPGGSVFFARYKGEIIGTAALLKADHNTFELTKMSVTEKYQGLQVGRKLAIRAIAQFEQSGAKTLFLESNSRLKPALRLYESLGFRHHPKKADSHYQRADVYMIYDPQNRGTGGSVLLV